MELTRELDGSCKNLRHPDCRYVFLGVGDAGALIVAPLP